MENNLNEMDWTLPTQEDVIENSLSGLNCAMQVLLYAAPAVGLSDEDALRLGSGFGGGMGHDGVCGCLTGAYMALGLHCGMAEPGDVSSMIRFRQYKAELDRRFSERFGSVNCPGVLEALKAETPDPGQVREGGRCAPAIIEACAILRDLLQEG